MLSAEIIYKKKNYSKKRTNLTFRLHPEIQYNNIVTFDELMNVDLEFIRYIIQYY